VKQVLEVEDKFAVPADWVMPKHLPSLGDSWISDEVRELDSTYFDTPSGGLRQFGITLRRRVGDEGTGWQLKVPNGSARIELQNDSNATAVPGELADAITALRAGEDLVEVARMTTTRRARRVLDTGGDLRVEIADDAVYSSTGVSGSEQTWREIEVEVGPAAGKKALRKTRKWLLAAGASPSTSANKLDRALRNGDAGRDVTDDQGTIGALVRTYIANQCDVIACNDVGLRAGQSLVHKTRVAVRRLRSTLRVFADLFHADPTARLNEDLVWYADLLGQVRDRDVLAEHLADRVGRLATEDVLGPVLPEIEHRLTWQRQEAWDRLRAEMDGERYANLLRLLREWRSAPPLTSAADAKAKRIRGYVDKAIRKADKRLRRAAGNPAALHSARKAAKRMRYAAELAEVTDPSLASVAKKGKARQTTLGDHQDAMVAAAFLRQLGASAGSTPGHNGFTYGLLMANELHDAAAIRAQHAA
jgi:CHAD domain-containing protein